MSRPEPCYKSQRGQATVEWVALILVIALLLSMLASLAGLDGLLKGRAFGDAIFQRILCAVRKSGSCLREDALAKAYGEDVAELVRDLAPEIVYEAGTKQMPVDFRRCRKTECADGVDDMVSLSRTEEGYPATAFVRVIDRRGRGGHLYVQYWFYFADSTTGLGSLTGGGRVVARALARGVVGKDPYHPDDWESYQVRIGRDGRREVRSSSHHGYKGCKKCDDSWYPYTGWHRVSGGSHAGHIPPGDTFERFTSASSLRLLPLETLPGRGEYEFAVTPPWLKAVYRDPESRSTN